MRWLKPLYLFSIVKREKLGYNLPWHQRISWKSSPVDRYIPIGGRSLKIARLCRSGPTWARGSHSRSYRETIVIRSSSSSSLLAYWVKGWMTRVTERKQRTKAPMMPSLVFFGEMPCAKGFLPKRLPKRSPPLSAYQEMQNSSAMYRGLRKWCHCKSLLNAIKNIAEWCHKRYVQVPEYLEQNADTGDYHGMADEGILLHEQPFLLILSPILSYQNP